MSSERGSVLVEVMVGAVVLAIATMAVLDGLAGAEDTGLSNKNRSVGSTLAQQDIERLRSFPITSLSNLDQTRSVEVGGVTYSVRSHTEWVRDESGVVSCTNDSTEAEYMKVSSTVTSPADAHNPVEEVTLLTPGPGAFSETAGSAAVKINDRDGKPLTGLTVTLSGPSTLAATTNELGCAIFGFVPAGTYEAEVTGYVGWGGSTGVAPQVQVTAAKTSLTQLELDRPVSIQANFETPEGAVARWTAVTVSNTKMTGGLKTILMETPFEEIENDTTLYSSIGAEGLFPFLDGYGLYAGTCKANNPATWDADYFQTSGKGSVAPEPGAEDAPVAVVMPLLKLKTTRTSGTFTRPRVQIRQTNTNPKCQQEMYDLARGTVKDNDWTWELSLPFGNYNLCVDYANGSGNNRRRTVALDLRTPVVSDTQMTFDKNDSGTSSGTCNL